MEYLYQALLFDSCSVDGWVMVWPEKNVGCLSDSAVVLLRGQMPDQLINWNIVLSRDAGDDCI